MALSDRRGQSLLAELVVWGMGFLVFVFAAPLLVEAVGISVSTGPVAFVINVIPWVMLLVLAGRAFRLVTGLGLAR